MDLIEKLKADLDKGYTKSDLERLIGLPQNCLSRVIKTGVGLSKKSEIKIEKWMASEKPDPLSVYYKPKEIKDLTKPTNQKEPQKPLGSKKSNVVIDTSKSNMPDPKDKVAYLKWLRNQP